MKRVIIRLAGRYSLARFLFNHAGLKFRQGVMIARDNGTTMRGSSTVLEPPHG